MKKIYVTIFIVLFIALVALPATAQENYSILEVENSMVVNYNFGADTVNQDQRFGVNFNLSDALDAGFIFEQGSGNNYLVFRYAFTNAVGLSVMYGNGYGMMASYNMLSNNVQGIVTNLRVNMEYLIDTVGDPVDQGIFGVSLSLGFGI